MLKFIPPCFTTSLLATILIWMSPCYAQEFAKGKLLHQTSFSNKNSVQGWKMEGLATLKFVDNWMQMYSPDQKTHHVYWCPTEFPDSFIAEWKVKNLSTEAGLLIVFFAAKGEKGQDVFSADLPKRDGTFTQYTQGKINSYHISYYANAAHNPNRPHVNLRKNNTFTLLQEGQQGIHAESTEVHRLRLVKHRNLIKLFIDNREVINYLDESTPTLSTGKIGFRQMKWSKFQYKDFKVWAIKN